MKNRVTVSKDSDPEELPAISCNTTGLIYAAYSLVRRPPLAVTFVAIFSMAAEENCEGRPGDTGIAIMCYAEQTRR